MNNSLSRYDELPASEMKQYIIDSYIGPLTCLINPSILQGVFPAELKLDKISDKMVYTCVIDFIDDNNILYDISLALENITLQAMP